MDKDIVQVYSNTYTLATAKTQYGFNKWGKTLGARDSPKGKTFHLQGFFAKQTVKSCGDAEQYEYVNKHP